MSILDDAIREHLELIRRRGATDSEVKRLEDEAFGPPTRPDEADFPEPEEAHGAAGAGIATEDQFDEPVPEALAGEDATTLLPTEGPEEYGEPTAEPHAEEAVQPQPGSHIPDPEDEAAIERPDHDELAAEVHPIVEGPPDGEEEPADEAGVPAKEGTSLYDRAQEGDLDLDLQLDEEPRAVEAPSEEQDVGEPEGAMPLEPPIESLDTVEHPFPDEITQGEEPQEQELPSEEHRIDQEPAGGDQPPGEAEPQGAEQGEDVLADTPEFLKDAPEDDELWFEQGEPKDFDF